MKVNHKVKHKVKHKDDQKGFVLVTVMLLTMMAGTVVLTSLQDTTVQERLSGNFQKKITARLMAEKGVYTSQAQMNTLLAATPTLSIVELEKKMQEIEAAENKNPTSKEISEQYGLDIKVDENNPNEIHVTSTGASYEGQVQLKAIYELVTGTAGSSNNTPISAGVTACKAISVTGAGGIDSYNSATGDYDENSNQGDNVSIQTLVSDSAIVFTGGTQIDGNVIAADTVTFAGGASITGNMESVGKITTTQGNVNIGGNVSTLSSFSQKNGSVGGTIHANGAITLEQTPVGGNVISRSTISITGIGEEVTTMNGKQISLKGIGGYVLASGNITLPNGGLIAGDAITHASYYQKGGEVNNIIAVNNVDITKWGTANNNSSSLNGTVTYGGVGRWINDGSAFTYSASSPAPTPMDVPLFESTIIATKNGVASTTTCDPDGIGSKVSDISDGIVAVKNLIIGGTGAYDANGDRPKGKYNGDVYVLNSSSGDFVLFTPPSGGSSAVGTDKSESVLKDMQNPTQTVDDPNADKTVTKTIKKAFFGENLEILMYTDVDIEGHLKVAENQDVTMYVQGDFTIAGAGSLTVPSTSSLTLIIEGKVEIAYGAQVSAHGITATSNKPAFSIYSSYSGADDGIYFGGGTEEVYAVIYAPLANVEVASGVGFGGSIYGNNVTVTGAGGVHYDTALGNINSNSTGTGGASASLVFKGWEYITEDVDDSKS